MYCMKYCYSNSIINIIHHLCNRQVRNAYTHALAYRWQVTTQSIREKLECEELLKVPNASGKAAFWQSFVCIDICGHDCRWWYLCLRPIIKVYLLVACVCVCVCVWQRQRVRELKVKLVLGRHECVQGEFYININKLVFSKSVSQGWSCRSRLAISSLDPPLINTSTDYDYNERVLVFYMFYFVKY